MHYLQMTPLGHIGTSAIAAGGTAMLSASRAAASKISFFFTVSSSDKLELHRENAF